jgi:hypothetical protein
MQLVLPGEHKSSDNGDRDTVTLDDEQMGMEGVIFRGRIKQNLVPHRKLLWHFWTTASDLDVAVAEVFQKFFDIALMEYIVEETNKYAQQ